VPDEIGADSATEAPQRWWGRSKLPRWALIAIAVLAAFLIGFLWQYVRASRLESTLAETRREHELTRLEATLATAVIEAQVGSYEEARQLMSDFFTGLQRNWPGAPAAMPDELKRILTQRDSVITILSRSNPESATLLSRLFDQYRAAQRRGQQKGPTARPGR
jgi:hypothetical protein